MVVQADAAEDREGEGQDRRRDHRVAHTQGIAARREPRAIPDQFREQQRREAGTQQARMMPQVQQDGKRRDAGRDRPRGLLPPGEAPAHEHQRQAVQEDQRAAAVGHGQREPASDDVEAEDVPAEERRCHVQEPERHHQAGEARLGIGEDQSARAVGQAEERTGKIDCRLRRPAHHLQPAPQFPRPHGHDDRYDNEQGAGDVPLDHAQVGQDQRERVPERVAERPERHSPHEAARQVHEEEGAAAHAGSPAGGRDGDTKSPQEPRREQEHRPAPIEPGADPGEAGVGLRPPCERLAAAAPRELVVDLVREGIGGRGDGNHEAEVKVAAVREEGRREQERVPFDHRAQEEDHVAEPEKFVFHHRVSGAAADDYN